ncbi:rRNA 2'-O-methyltransferase fibrillarin [Trifolium repens]|nr:rRNA 2'-O-methyltransferase fibrillarin [Trifolium repens]
MSSSSSSSSYSEWKEIEKVHNLYRAMFGESFADFPPPPPPPPPYSFNVPQRPSKLPHPSVITPHPLIPDVYVASGRNLDDLNDSESLFLYTRNLVPGFKSHDQDVVFSVQDEDGGTVEYREWDPYKSRLAAAILSGAKNIWIKRGSRVLFILSQDDAQFGITLSHVSDIVGSEGMVYVVEETNCNSLLHMAENRSNIVPICYGFTYFAAYEYNMLINLVDVVFAALNPDSRQEATSTCLNATYFLKTGGHYMLYVQGNCTESTNQGDGVFKTLSKEKKVQFQRKERVTLEPFDGDHVYVSGVFRTLEVDEIDQSCLVSIKFLTSQDIHGGVRRPATLYEKLKDRPKYMLFESSYGYALFEVFGMHNIETHYIATEEYIKNFNTIFRLVACYAFGSTDEALKYLNAIKNDTLPEKLFEFLDKNLPSKRMEGGEHCYSLALLNAPISGKIVKAKIACSSNVIHTDIARGVRMNIDKFFKKLKPGELEEAQVNLARSYCKQKRDSPDKGNLPKKRGASLVSSPTRQNPKRKARANTKTK